jgi:hypothetical protein
MTESDKKHMIRVNGKEELPCVDSKEKTKKANNRSVLFLKKSPKKTSKNRKFVESPAVAVASQCASNNNNNNNDSANTSIGIDNEPSTSGVKADDSSDGNNNCGDDNNVKYSTLPMVNKQKHKRTIAIPQRTTADGTKIFYVCDLPKKMKKGVLIYDQYYFMTCVLTLFISSLSHCRTR